jgi:predicted nucleic acid-binding protein
VTVERPRYVVDATVVGKWFLQEAQDERYVGLALELLRDFQAARVALLAPDHLTYEVSSIICKAVGGNRLDPARAISSITTLLSYPISLVQDQALLLEGARLSIWYRCTFYDAMYMGLAESRGYRFVHADDKLRRTLGGRFPLELWIEDYQPSSR